MDYLPEVYKTKEEKKMFKLPKTRKKFNRENMNVTLVVQNKCTICDTDELIGSNWETVMREIVEVIIKHMNGDCEDPLDIDADLVYREMEYSMKDFCCLLTLVNEHNKRLLTREVEFTDDDEFKSYTYFNSVYRRFSEEVGPVRYMSFAQEVFACAIKELRKKIPKDKKQQLEFWEIWLQSKIEQKPIVYDENTCKKFLLQSGDKYQLVHINDYVKLVEKRLLKNYPDISTGRRKVVENHDIYDTVKYMCSDPAKYKISEPELPIEEEELEIIEVEQEQEEGEEEQEEEEEEKMELEPEYEAEEEGTVQSEPCGAMKEMLNMLYQKSVWNKRSIPCLLEPEKLVECTDMYDVKARKSVIPPKKGKVKF